MCVVTWLHHLPGGWPAFFPATDSRGAPAVCDQYRPQQVKKFILSFGGLQSYSPAGHSRGVQRFVSTWVDCCIHRFHLLFNAEQTAPDSVAPATCVFFTCIAHPSVGWLLLCSCVCTIFVLGWSWRCGSQREHAAVLEKRKDGGRTAQWFFKFLSQKGRSMASLTPVANRVTSLRQRSVGLNWKGSR